VWLTEIPSLNLGSTSAFVPPPPQRLVDSRPNRAKVIQSCDLWVSADGLVYCSDFNDGLFILEYAKE